MTSRDDLYRMRIELETEIARQEARIPRAPGTPAINTRNHLDRVAELYGITVGEILSDTRTQNVARARQAACWLFRIDGFSLPEIGRIVGRDHTTVLHACRQIDGDPARRALLWSLVRGAAA